MECRREYGKGELKLGPFERAYGKLIYAQLPKIHETDLNGFTK